MNKQEKKEKGKDKKEIRKIDVSIYVYANIEAVACKRQAIVLRNKPFLLS